MVPGGEKIIKFGTFKTLFRKMNRESLNRIAAVVAIVCGVLTVSLLTLTAPDFRPLTLISWKFILGLMMIAVGIFALRMRGK